MTHLNATSALAEATPVACRKLLAHGVTHTVLVENKSGEWLLLHAENAEHAKTLAQAWVNHIGARGCTCRPIKPNGLGKVFYRLWQSEEE